MSAVVKIAYVVPPSKQFAGIERVVHEIASGLQSAHGAAFDVHVIYCSPYPDAVLVHPVYKKHVLNVDRLIGLPAPLRALVRDERFDVLIAPQVEASAISWVSTRGLGLPVFISHLHGNPDLEEREGTLRTKASFLLYRHVLARSIDAILAVSPSLAAFTRTSLAKKVPVHFAKNPVRDMQAPPRKLRADGVFEFVCLGRLSRQKGQDTLLRALALARPDLPPVVLRLVGNGPAESELRALCTELGLDDIVEFAGYVSDPSPYLSRADCFVLASRWEGFGVALAEAMQFGLPLLSTECRFGPSDLIDDPRIGETVAVDDVDALAAGLRRAVDSAWDPDADAYRRTAAAAYLPEAATASHFEILSTVLRGRAPALASRITV